MDPLLPSEPAEVGPYVLLGRLGSGGMGTVYLGVSPVADRVAIKLVRSGRLSRDSRRRFAAEVAHLRRVYGARVARFEGADLDSEPPWLAVEYVPGRTLARHVQQAGPLPVPQVAILGAALAEGLMKIHDAGVLHRDLKPANIMLGPDGPKVIDFGLATLHERTRSHLTDPGVLVGTLDFMSPEQVRGEPKLTPAVDVYALGACLVYAATGRLPYPPAPIAATIRRIADPADPPALDDVPPALAGLLARMLAYDPADRPPPAALLRRLIPLATADGGSVSDLRQRLVDRTHPTAEPPSTADQAGTPTAQPSARQAVTRRRRILARPPARPDRYRGRRGGIAHRHRRRGGGRSGGALLTAVFAVVLLVAALATAIVRDPPPAGRAVPAPSPELPPPKSMLRPPTPGIDQLFYLRRWYGGVEVVSWHPGRREPVRLHELPAQAYFNVNISPNGRWLSWVDEVGQLRLFDLYGAQPERVLRHAVDGLLLEPVWSPDSRQLLVNDVSRGPDRGTPGLLDLADGAFRPLPPTLSGARHAAWAPDGYAIAFVLPDGGLALSAPDGTKLHRVPGIDRLTAAGVRIRGVQSVSPGALPERGYWLALSTDGPGSEQPGRSLVSNALVHNLGGQHPPDGAQPAGGYTAFQAMYRPIAIGRGCYVLRQLSTPRGVRLSGGECVNGLVEPALLGDYELLNA
jgi:serine/threonine protein kinase